MERTGGKGEHFRATESELTVCQALYAHTVSNPLHLSDEELQAQSPCSFSFVLAHSLSNVTNVLMYDAKENVKGSCGSWWEGETEERLGCPGLRRMSRGWGSRGKRVFKGRVLLHEAGAEGLTGLLGSSCSPRSPSCPQGGHTASSLCLKLSPSSFLKTEVLWMVT